MLDPVRCHEVMPRPTLHLWREIVTLCSSLREGLTAASDAAASYPYTFVHDNMRVRSLFVLIQIMEYSTFLDHEIKNNFRFEIFFSSRHKSFPYYMNSAWNKNHFRCEIFRSKHKFSIILHSWKEKKLLYRRWNSGSSWTITIIKNSNKLIITNKYLNNKKKKFLENCIHIII